MDKKYCPDGCAFKCLYDGFGIYGQHDCCAKFKGPTRRVTRLDREAEGSLRLPECAAAPFPPDVVEWRPTSEKAVLRDDEVEIDILVRTEKETVGLWLSEPQNGFTGEIEAWAYLPGRRIK